MTQDDTTSPADPKSISGLTRWVLVRRGLVHYRRTHLGVLLGVACTAAVLVGALGVGDSVRESLRRRAEERIGRVDAVFAPGDRFFRADLADRIAVGLEDDDHDNEATVAPALLLPGLARTTTGKIRSSSIDVIGCDERFFALAPGGGPTRSPPPGRAFVAEALAGRLNLTVGDVVLLRVEKPSVIPRDMVMSQIDDISFAVRVQIDRILAARDFGRFGLRATPTPPANVFVDRTWFAEQLETKGRANILLLGRSDTSKSISTSSSSDLLARADAAVRRHWTLADAELAIHPIGDTTMHELTSARIFVDRPVTEVVGRLAPSAVGVLAYFVNAIRHRTGDETEHTTPYSMIAAVGPLNAPSSDSTLRDLVDLTRLAPAGDVERNDHERDGIVINSWLADDLALASDDIVTIDAYRLGSSLRLEEDSHEFVVRRTVALEGVAADRTLMPDFPGMANSEDCRDWEPGVPVDLDRIRDKDEDYWDAHRGTPKAFVSLDVARSLWGNRFGDLTAIRMSADDANRVRTRLAREFDPARLGFFFRDVRGPARATSVSATDFGGLFIGLSLFLVVAALLLTALLFAFGVEQRSTEVGTLLAVGYRPRDVRRLFLGEAMVISIIGAIAGAGFGVLYTRVVLWGLSTIWSGAVGAATVEQHVGLATILIGIVASVVVAMLAVFVTLRRKFDRDAVALLRNDAPLPATTTYGHASPTRRHRSTLLATIALVAALVIVVVADSDATESAAAFFGAGALVLVGGLLLAQSRLRSWADDGRTSSTPLDSIRELAFRHAGRRHGRSTTTIALLASGVFLVASIQNFRLEPPRRVDDRASGTGGFALFGQSRLPILRDLETTAGREAFGLDEQALADVAIVPLRVHDGDEASCLELGRPQAPRLVGIDPEELAERGAFTFVKVIGDDPVDSASAWRRLHVADDDEADQDDDIVPAIGDHASITWAVKKGIGDTIDYRDEHGRPFRVRIVATVASSILQGQLVIDETAFAQRFPGTRGHRMFLVDAKTDRVDAIADTLTRSLEDVGLELESTTDRLAAFQAVQNTYLLIFQALGGLGLLLGSVGLGTVVLRNMLERRREFAVLRAVGFTARQVRRLVVIEHGVLLGLGLVIGLVAAALAVWPVRSTSESSLAPTAGLALVLVGLGAIQLLVAVALGMRGATLETLQSD